MAEVRAIDCGFKVQVSKGRRDPENQVCGSIFTAELPFSGLSIVAGQCRVRFGQEGDGGFDNFRMVFRCLVPMNMDSGSSPE
jgi:hypothetical protein